MRTRARMVHQTTPQQAVARFTSELEGDSLNYDASRYGLVLALTASAQLERAQQTLLPLLQHNPEKIAYVIAQVDIDAAGENYTSALTRLQQQLIKRPENHALNLRYAELLMKSGNYPLSEEVLEDHAKRRPKDDYVWYLLAEVHGLAGNILSVHTARAEYFILNGVYDKAQTQLNNALKLAKGNYHKTALLEERIKDIHNMREKNQL